jgi:hypothetical protein
MSSHEISATELPEYLMEQISTVIHSFSTGLIKIPDRPRGQEAVILIGSGTFVSIDGVDGILTAHHVARQLDMGSSLGVICVPEEHRKDIQFDLIEVIEVARGSVESEGPDLSFIKLPRAFVSEIRAYKQFFNMSLHRERTLNGPMARHDGIWFICGIPDELTTEEKSQRESGQAKFFHSICGMVAPNKEYSIKEYDYIEADIDGNAPQIVSTFGGVSGGGLWQVPLRRNPDGNIEPSDYILSGVAFYESGIGSERGFIRCHGRISVYRYVYNKITGQSTY